MRAFVKDVLPRLARYDTVVLVNVCGDTVDEYAEVTRVLDDAPGVHGLEINISCPNVKKGGMAFGGDPVMTHEVIKAVRKATRLPVIPKLSPNVGDITVFARAAEDAGADALSCINTLLGLAIDVETRRPRLAFGTGGLSGPAIRPIAVRMAWQAARAVKIPVIGIGGITSRRRRPRVPDRRVPGRPGRHRELRRPGALRPHPGRAPRLPGATRARRREPGGGDAAIPGAHLREAYP